MDSDVIYLLALSDKIVQSFVHLVKLSFFWTPVFATNVLLIYSQTDFAF